MLVKGSVQQSAHLFLGNIYQRITAKELDGPLGEQLEVHFRINIQGERNTEVAMRIETDMEGQKLFGDSVGMQVGRRGTGIHWSGSAASKRELQELGRVG